MQFIFKYTVSWTLLYVNQPVIQTIEPVHSIAPESERNQNRSAIENEKSKTAKAIVKRDYLLQLQYPWTSSTKIRASFFIENYKNHLCLYGMHIVKVMESWGALFRLFQKSHYYTFCPCEFANLASLMFIWRSTTMTDTWISQAWLAKTLTLTTL